MIRYGVWKPDAVFYLDRSVAEKSSLIGMITKERAQTFFLKINEFNNTFARRRDGQKRVAPCIHKFLLQIMIIMTIYYMSLTALSTQIDIILRNNKIEKRQFNWELR